MEKAERRLTLFDLLACHAGRSLGMCGSRKVLCFFSMKFMLDRWCKVGGDTADITSPQRIATKTKEGIKTSIAHRTVSTTAA